tara:strand:+ start:4558 stop:5373 length:816 start_codon:yes stop_codon:yes gene_type:complete
LNNFFKNIFLNGTVNFKNVHEGEECYIFGNGPSIKWFDLKAFSDRPSIVTGQLYYHKDFDYLNVLYCAMIEPWFFSHKLLRTLLANPEQSRMIDNYRMVIKDYKNFIKKNVDIHFFINISNLASIRKKNVHYLHNSIQLIWNHTDEKIFNKLPFSGSFHTALFIAYFLGFKKVFLVGFDAMTLTPTKNIRFYEYGKGVPGTNRPLNDPLLKIFMNEMYISTVSFNKDVVNVKPVLYEELVGEKIKYKENFEIVDKKYLDIMNSCEGYKIYK